MFKSGLPFDEVTPTKIAEKAIPRKPEEFVEYVEYLATSPQLDHSPVKNYILNFISSPKIKPDHVSSVYFAIHDLKLPEDFWRSYLQQIHTDLTVKNVMAEGIIYSLASAPTSAIKHEWNSFSFLTPFLSHDNLNVVYSTLSTLYAFRNDIKIDQTLIDTIFANITCRLAKLVFISLNWLSFLVAVDYPEIKEKIQARSADLLRIITIHGHQLNISLLTFIVDQVKPEIQQILNLLPHVSLSSASFLLTWLSNAPDFSRAVDLPADTVLPRLIDVISHPYSEGMREELFITALQLTKQSKSQHFFDRLTNILLNNESINDFDVVALYADVAQSFSQLPLCFEKAEQVKSKPALFYDLAAVSAMMASEEGFDISKYLLHLLSQQSKHRHWRLAASAVLQYCWYHYDEVARNFQQFLEVAQEIQYPDIRGLYLIVFAYFVPAHLRSQLIEQMIRTLVPSKYQSSDVAALKFQPLPSKEVPLLVQTGLVRMLKNIATESELEPIQSKLNEPIFAHFVQEQLPAMKHGLPMPVSNFSVCNIEDIGDLAAALYCQKTGKSGFTACRRPFISVSPVSHAMTAEISTVVVPKHRSMTIDLRISSKALIPSMTICLEVPLSLTPSQVTPWEIKDLEPGSKVTRRFSFSVNRLFSPYASLVVTSEDARVLDVKICLPLIDLFDKIKPSTEILDCLWWKMRHERHDVDIEDSVWVCPSGCIAVRNHVARASDPAYLEMLASSHETRAVVN